MDREEAVRLVILQLKRLLLETLAENERLKEEIARYKLIEEHLIAGLTDKESK